MKCPMCGETNKLEVRFCEHCGARLDAPSTEATPVMPAIVPALTCPQCGAVVLPGEATCESCGHTLPNNTAMSAGMPILTQMSSELQVVDLPVEGFADTANDLNVLHQQTPTSVSGPIEYRIENTDDAPASDVQDEVAVPAAPEVVDAPVLITDDEPITAAHVADTSVATPAAAPVGDVQAIKRRRQELDDEMTRQRNIIKQLDQMHRAFREVTPQAVLMGIAEAEEKLQAAQAELDNLPVLPEVDPAVIERLQKDLARQLEIIEQFEQLQHTFASATPRAVLQGIIDARQTEEQIRAELKTLGVDVMLPRANSQPVNVPPVVVPPSVPQMPVAPMVPPTPPPAVLAPVNEVAAPIAMPEPVVNPVVNPVAPAARLQLESGTIVPLPTGRREIIIGRDDPISGVHPEIDLTPYGAESGGVSRRHVRLTVVDGQWMITDLQSTNHTRVNGVRIDPGVPTLLPDSAQVVLGRIGFIFRSS
ncbi:MAG: FHA domain-containing protein [Roseiflexaceae bacterium]|nr:FHA domain-containing protein [Chloroflexaceae bacterium]